MMNRLELFWAGVWSATVTRFWMPRTAHRPWKPQPGPHNSAWSFSGMLIPEPNGRDTIAAFRERLPHVKIIAISGAFGEELRRLCEKVGAAAMLHKPVDGSELLETVQAVLRG